MQNVEVILANFKRAYSGSAEICQSVIKFYGDFIFTKSPELSRLEADFEVDHSTFNHALERISTTIGFGEIKRRFKKLNLSPEWPQHLPIRLKSGTQISGYIQNVFLSFPLCIGRIAQEEKDIFGFEFVDRSEDILCSILPRIKNTFINSGQVLKSLKRVGMSTYIYGVFHEKGHLFGNISILLKPYEGLEFGYALPAFREYMADLTAFKLAGELPDVILSSFFQRLYWYSQTKNNYDPDKLCFLALFNLVHDCFLRGYASDKLYIDLNRLVSVLANAIDSVPHLEMSDSPDKLQKWWSRQIKLFEENGSSIYREILKDRALSWSSGSAI